MSIDTKVLRGMAIAQEVSVVEDVNRATELREAADELDRLREDVLTRWKPLLAATRRAHAVYTDDDAPKPDLAGTYIVATTEYERLGDLEEAADACTEIR